MENYISNKTIEMVKAEDKALFLEDIREDLNEIDISRIAGLGITPQDLAEWLDSSSRWKNNMPHTSS